MTQNFNEGVTSNGLDVMSYDNILQFEQDSLNAAYAQDGETINFDSETPDGQATNIGAQLGTDVRELAHGVYNSFDPDKCSGSVQDSRYALNYLFRKGGTFTIQNIDVTVNKTVDLQGLDGSYNDVNAASYTVSDDAGNLWYLIDSTTLTAGTTSLPFRSQNYGSYTPVIGTITNQVTKVLGVTSVINSVAPTTLGVQQETDLQFKLRRNRSTSVKGQNSNDSMLGQLLDLDGVSDAITFINIPGNDDYDENLPDYSVWVIVEGGANSDIANVIYQNSTGLPMYAFEDNLVTPAIVPVEVDVPAVSGQVFNVKFNRANPVPLYIRFTYQPSALSTGVYNADGIKSYIAENLIFGLDEAAETSKVTAIASDAILANGGGGYALNVEISIDGINYTDYIQSASRQDKFVVDATRITINIGSST